MSTETAILFTEELAFITDTYDVLLLLTRRKNGSFTLKAKKSNYAGTDHCYCSRPFRSGKAFLIALDWGAGELWGEPLSLDRIEALLPAVEALDPSLAQRVKQALPSLEAIRADDDANERARVGRVR